ncbi:MAG: DNA polymerase III subunit delta [Ignavibacteria bacterium]
MAKTDKKYLTTYKSFTEYLHKNKIPPVLLLSINEKVLIDDIIKTAAEKFAENSVNIIIYFNADEKVIEDIVNECSNFGLFSEKKVVVLRNVNKLSKNEKLAMIEYFKRVNEDTCLIMISSEIEFNPAKIFLYDVKEDSQKAEVNKKVIEKNVMIFEIEDFSEPDTIAWVREKFDGYKIDDSSIKYFLQFSNYSFDELLTEIEKLKTYCFQSKEITPDIINLCNGIAKDFNETDFIMAVMERKLEKALLIYERISLKKDVEVFLIFLLTSAFTIINKLYDPAVSSLKEWQLKKELKLWFPDQEKLLPSYRSFKNTNEREKIKKIFNYIYESDKIMKTTASDKRTNMYILINRICCI